MFLAILDLMVKLIIFLFLLSACSNSAKKDSINFKEHLVPGMKNDSLFIPQIGWCKINFEKRQCILHDKPQTLKLGNSDFSNNINSQNIISKLKNILNKDIKLDKKLSPFQFSIHRVHPLSKIHEKKALLSIMSANNLTIVPSKSNLLVRRAHCAVAGHNHLDENFDLIIYNRPEEPFKYLLVPN